MPHIKYFLFNAWREKSDFAFCGIPRCLILGRHIIERFPEIQNLSITANVDIQLASSGFVTGVRSMLDWERNIRFFTFFLTLRDIAGELICSEINMRDSGKTEPNLLKWANNNPRGRIINDFAEFEKMFSQ